MVSCNESSSHASNSFMFSAVGYEQVNHAEFFGKSNVSLGKLLADAEYDYADAEIVVDGVSVGVHRCILALRSQFFHELFKRGKDRSMLEGKPKYSLSDLVPYGEIGYESFMVILNYLYTGELKPSPPEVATCIDGSCAHGACAPAINHVVELMYLSSTFMVKDLVQILQRRLVNFVGKAFVEDVIPITMVAFHCQLNQLGSHCFQRIALSDLHILTLEKELPHEVFRVVKSFRDQYQGELKDNTPEVDPLYDKNVRRIHKAMESDDVELLKILLHESDITLDDAHGLHYAVAYCCPKLVRKVLSLGNADLNLRNSRGYTVLHVAARRKDPAVIVDLLSNGACVSDTTVDGQTAITICRRLTRPKDYNESTRQGQETNTDQLCIDVLEREMLRNHLPGQETNADRLCIDVFEREMPRNPPASNLTILLLLENRVALARLLFPMEAKLAMQMEHPDSTSEFRGFQVDLNEVPFDQVQGLKMRIHALQKTVETGRRFFPHCSDVLDRLLDDETEGEMLGTLLLEEDRPEVQSAKRMRYMELKDKVMKAFDGDKAKINEDNTGRHFLPNCSEILDSFMEHNMQDEAENIRTDPSFSSSSETDTLLLGRFRKLLQGNAGGQMPHRRLEKAMLTLDIDKAGTNWTSFSPSSSCSISPYCGV